MKVMNKIILLMVSIVLLSISVVYGASANVTLKSDKEEISVGDIVELKLNVNCEDGVSAIVANIDYDKTALTLEKLELADGWMNFGTNEKLEILINKAEKITELDVCKITFKVGENFKEGTTKISVTGIQVSDVSGNSNVIDNQEKILKAKNVAEDDDGNNKEEKVLESIQITKVPTKVDYKEGENFDKTGMEITAQYSDGTSKKVEDYKVTPSENLKLENTDITISYTENGITKTIIQKIKVTKVEDKQPTNNNQNTTKENTIANNKNNVVTNKVNSNKNDGTLANKVIPAAGEKMMIIPFGTIIILTIVFYIKYKKYKND